MDKDYLYDFPCSRTFRDFEAYTQEGIDSLETEPKVSQVETIHFTRYINHNVATSLYDRIAELQREVDDLKKRKIRKDIL